MTDLISNLSAVARRFASAKRLSLARVSTLVFGNSRKLRDVVAGKADLNTRIWERSVQWFSDNWPAGVDWPEGIDRPQHAAGEADPDTS